MFVIQPCVRAVCLQVPKVQRPSKNVCQWPELYHTLFNQKLLYDQSSKMLTRSISGAIIVFFYASMCFLNLVHHCFVVPVISIRSSRPVEYVNSICVTGDG